MPANNVKVNLTALSELKSKLTQLSNSLHEIFSLMNTYLSEIGNDWRDGKYDEFVEGYRPLIENCEKIAVSYEDWCRGAIDPLISSTEDITTSQMTPNRGSSPIVSGSVVGESSSHISSEEVSDGNYGKGIKIGDFYVGSKPKTKAEPISNGCGSDVFPITHKLAEKYGIPKDAKSTGTSEGEQIASCDQHDKDYYFGVPKEQADGNFRERSPFMGKVVADENLVSKKISNVSYKSAQKGRETSERLRPTWEEENQQCLNSDDYTVKPNN